MQMASNDARSSLRQQRMVTSTRSRLRQQRTWSPDPEQTPSTTYSVATSTRGSPRHQRRLEQTPSSATQRAQPIAPPGAAPIINVAWSRLYRQRAPSIAPLGAGPIINVIWSRLHRQRLNVLSQQHRSEQTPSSTSLGTDSIVSDSMCSANSTARSRHHHQRCLEQTPSSATQRAQSTAPLGTAPVINVAWSRLHRQHAQSTAPPGAVPVINVCVNRTGSTEGLRMSPLHNNQRHLQK